MKLKAFAVGVVCILLATVARANLLGLTPGYPLVNFDSSDPASISYDPTTQTLAVDSVPLDIVFSDLDSSTLVVSNRSIQIQLDTDGNMVSGTNGFSLTGTLTYVNAGVTNVYSGLLLQGDVAGFGSVAEGSISQFDFLVSLTGGQLKSLFSCSSNLAVTLTCEASSFDGTFTNAFSGPSKGVCGPNSTNAPVVNCPPLSQVVTTPATDPNSGAPGFIITYPDPVVTDTCDPNPFVFCDTPSGSFVALNPGDNLTVTCYGIDVAGNFGFCSFTVVMGQTNSCALAFTDSGCAPTTLTNDPGQCSAAYNFTAPFATNCTGQLFRATATATNEAGGMIALTSLGNGIYQGVFPKTMTSDGNVITFTANDGQGDAVVRQCQVLVVDKQPPVIMCLDQTATFKPILTNAESCIEADFDDTCIPASNYLWFSSVISTAGWRNQGSFTVHVTDQTITLQVDCTNIALNVPDAYVTFSNGVAVSTTTFTNNQWVTCARNSTSGNAFVSGLAWQIPFNLNNPYGNFWGRDRDNGKLRRKVNSATWCARFAVDTPGIVLQWQWGAVVEKTLNTNCSALFVKSVDDNYDSRCRNSDPAGTCEDFKSSLVCGGRGKGISYGRPDCTGILSPVERCNLGRGTICEGAVNFATPKAYDNCGNPVTVTCVPPSGSVFGPGQYTIATTAVDSSGNSNQCSFTLTVVPPLQVVFDTPACDNIADNICKPDAGFADFNCPDDPQTPNYANCFRVGDKLCHVVRLLDCNGNDVTSTMSSCVTVHIDVTERQGSPSDSTLVSDVSQNYSGVGCPGGIMVPTGGTFQYTLNTSGYEAGTINKSRFFRSCVWVEYNSSPGVPVGMEDVILESR